MDKEKDQNLIIFERKKERMPIRNYFASSEKNNSKAICEKYGQSKS